MAREQTDKTVSLPTSSPSPSRSPTPTPMPMPMPNPMPTYNITPMPMSTREMDNDSYWREIFNRYDLNKDGLISYTELKALVNSSEAKDLSKNTVKNIMALADTDDSETLDFEEFKAMMQNPKFSEWFGHYMMVYAHTIVPSPLLAAKEWNTLLASVFPDNYNLGVFKSRVKKYLLGQWHEYHSVAPKEGIRGRLPNMMTYTCWPPPLFMILTSLLEVVLFGYDAAHGNTRGDGIIGSIFHYDPEKRSQAWRFITYMLVHSSYSHLIRNVVVQLFLGIPLEMMHFWWRVALVYIAGVASGSLAQSVADPQQQLVGASGGVAALLTAHISAIVMNFTETKRAVYQLIAFVILAGWAIGGAIYDLYWGLNEKIGHVIHVAGAIAGLLVGFGVLRNVRDQKWERRLRWAAICLYFGLMVAGVLANFFWITRFNPNVKKYIISAGGAHRSGINFTTTEQSDIL